RPWSDRAAWEGTSQQDFDNRGDTSDWRHHRDLRAPYHVTRSHPGCPRGFGEKAAALPVAGRPPCRHTIGVYTSKLRRTRPQPTRAPRSPVAIHIGTSGWSYNHWQGIVYPRGASSLRRLDAYVARFATVEVNNTFYRWPKEDVFSIWRQRTPADFVFSIKASRGLTQFRKLSDPIPWLERMDAGLRRLGEKMGVLLFQLPPHFPYHPERLAHFLDAAPSWPRLAIEFRHPTWHREETYLILEAHG